MHEKPSRRRGWRLIAGLALVVVGLGVFVVLQGSIAPLLTYLPFLLILACPLMMIFMMGSMNSMDTMHHHSGPQGLHDGAYDNTPTMEGLTRDEQIWALRNELTKMAWQQETLRQDLERLEGKHLVDADKTPVTS